MVRALRKLYGTRKTLKGELKNGYLLLLSWQHRCFPTTICNTYSGASTVPFNSQSRTVWAHHPNKPNAISCSSLCRTAFRGLKRRLLHTSTQECAPQHPAPMTTSQPADPSILIAHIAFMGGAQCSEQCSWWFQLEYRLRLRQSPRYYERVGCGPSDHLSPSNASAHRWLTISMSSWTGVTIERQRWTYLILGAVRCRLRICQYWC
jgi:hypothetical protein